MGRMLEALKNKEAGRLGLREKPFFEDTIEHATEVEQYIAPDDAIPFVEVGPNKKIEGSAQVMAVKHPGQPSVRLPHLEVDKETRRPADKETHVVSRNASLSASLSVSYEPWPTLPQVGHGVASEIIAYHHPEHAISRQYASLMAKVREGLGDTKVVLLTGCRSHVGATTVLLNLAVAATQQDKGRIAVVDANLRRPSLASKLGFTSAAGMQEVFQGRLALEQAVVQTAVTGLHLVPAQPMATQAPLKPDAVRWLFSWLSDHFNLVLVDAPSMDAGSELSALITACDCVYMVVPEGESEPSQRALGQSLTAMGAKLRGLFHTQCNS